jgi:alkaline phosphatase D
MNGISSGDVTSQSSVIWARADQESLMHVQYDDTPNFSNNLLTQTLAVNQSTNHIGHIKLINMTHNTVYYYRVWFSDPNNSTLVSNSISGKFKTAPDMPDRSNINFVIAGDLGGSSLCRHSDLGYSILAVMKSLSPDFFIFNGDQIYADRNCPEKPSSFTLRHFPGWKNIKGDFPSNEFVNWTNLDQLRMIYLKHWEYNRNDTHLQNLLSSTSMYSQADDHEVINDYGGQWNNYSIKANLKNKEGYPNLVKAGIDLFFEFSPIDRNKIEPDRIYRSFNWGKDIDLLLLDAHSYRSLNNLPDTIQYNKTLYGEQQLDWLKSELNNSNSTWKVISTPVPVTIPNCFGEGKSCDNWATTGTTDKTFVRERNAFLEFLDKQNLKNIIFVATDVHFAGTVKVTQDFDSDGDTFTFYEMVNGPLNTFTQNMTNPVDPTLNANYLYNESAIFNFGHFRTQQYEQDQKAHLFYEVVGADGRFRPNSQLELIPEP